MIHLLEGNFLIFQTLWKDFLQFVQPNFESIEKSSRFATGEIPNWGSPFGNAT